RPGILTAGPCCASFACGAASSASSAHPAPRAGTRRASRSWRAPSRCACAAGASSRGGVPPARRAICRQRPEPMPRLTELLPRDRQLALAVRAHTPGRLAETFASYAGQFYDRRDFDLLAREVRTLYAASGDEPAATFQARLDARLERRAYAPVRW